ncbi:hypothetical protein JW979_04980, partial [bacterium]|nr:hypothetical protein [candidate division CSSED10-310 bacterium]
LIFYTMNWQPLLDAEKVQDEKIIQQIPADVQMVDRLDAAFLDDEKRCHFHIYSRYAYNQALPVLAKGKIHEKEVIDAVFPVVGGAFNTMNTLPEKDHWLVLRTMTKQEVLFNRLDGVIKQKINTNRVQFLTLWVGDQYRMKIDVSGANDSEESQFIERIVRIPGSAIQSKQTEFGLVGDHLFCDLWLFAAP